MPQTIKESRGLAVKEAADAKSGRLQVGLITPGWGSSGYYSDKVLENAATAKVFPAGTQMFLDHPGETEAYDRPERSVRDLAAVLTEDAVWDGNGLVAEAQVFGPFVDMLTDENLAATIGVSIRAAAEVTTGEADGRKGRIITQLIEGVSADFVTKAGRGGSILQILESARPSVVVERAVAHGVTEATANDTQQALSQALREEYGGDKSWAWVRDFDDTTVWYEHETPDESGTYAEGYTLDDNGAVTLAGQRIEVRARTEYVAVAPASSDTTNAPAPAGQSTATESEETTMATTQIEESRLAQLETDAQRAIAAESERDTARKELAEAHRAADTSTARDLVREAATEANVELDEFQLAGIVAGFPLTEAGRLDEEKFKTAVEKAVAKLAEAGGAGQVVGFGGSARFNGSGEVTEADVDKVIASAFGREIKEA